MPEAVTSLVVTDPFEMVTGLAQQADRMPTEWLAAILAAHGDASTAADLCRARFDERPDRGRHVADLYVVLMAAAGRIDEAVAVLEEYTRYDGPFSAYLLMALAAAHGVRDDDAAMRMIVSRLRRHHAAARLDVSVRTDVIDATVAIAEGDDVRAARLFRELTDTDDTARRDHARPLLIALADRMMAGGKACLIPGARPLLEYACEVAPPAVATWSATSLAHLATVEDRSDDAEAAVRLAARHLSPDQVSILRSALCRRTGRHRDAVTVLVDACQTGQPPELRRLLAAFHYRDRPWLDVDEHEQHRLRAAIDQAMFNHEGDRHHLAAALAAVEEQVFHEYARASVLWQAAAESDDPAVSGWAWLHVGYIEHFEHPVVGVQAFEQAMHLGDDDVTSQAAFQLIRLGQRLHDDIITARGAERLIELAEGDNRATAALWLGRIYQHNHPDDAEDAYHTAIHEPGVHPWTVGAALAHLGALHARHGNRRLAQQTWRRGRRHRDPAVVEAFQAERTKIGRVTRIDQPRHSAIRR